MHAFESTYSALPSSPAAMRRHPWALLAAMLFGIAGIWSFAAAHADETSGDRTGPINGNARKEHDTGPVKSNTGAIDGNAPRPHDTGALPKSKTGPNSGGVQADFSPFGEQSAPPRTPPADPADPETWKRNTGRSQPLTRSEIEQRLRDLEELDGPDAAYRTGQVRWQNELNDLLGQKQRLSTEFETQARALREQALSDFSRGIDPDRPGGPGDLLKKLEGRYKAQAELLDDQIGRVRTLKEGFDAFAETRRKKIERFREALARNEKNFYGDYRQPAPEGKGRPGSGGQAGTPNESPRRPSPGRSPGGAGSSSPGESDLAGRSQPRPPSGDAAPRGKRSPGANAADEAESGLSKAKGAVQRLGGPVLEFGLGALAAKATWDAGDRSFDRLRREEVIREGLASIDAARRRSAEELRRLVPELDPETVDFAQLTERERETIQNIAQRQDPELQQQILDKLAEIDRRQAHARQTQQQAEMWRLQRTKDGWNLNPFADAPDSAGDARFGDVMRSLKEYAPDIERRLEQRREELSLKRMVFGDDPPPAPPAPLRRDALDGAIYKSLANPATRAKFPADWSDDQVASYIRANLDLGHKPTHGLAATE